MATQDDRREFRFGLGHVVLEFLATLAGREQTPLERLRRPQDLERWLEQAALATEPACDERVLVEARALREALHRAVDAARHGRPPESADVRLLNATARRRGAAPQLGPHLTLVRAGRDPARAALSQLAVAGIELLAGPDLRRIRNCAAPGCSLLFVDRSRPGRRRWCSMERCGNRAKTARYRRRTRTSPADARRPASPRPGGSGTLRVWPPRPPDS